MKEEKNQYKVTALTDISMFIDVIRDRICDWISYHNYQPNLDLVDIRAIEFYQKIDGSAFATYRDINFGHYEFHVYFNFKSQGVFLKVIENSTVRHTVVTRKWDGISCELCFDKNGDSYEVDRSAYELLKSAGLSNQERI